MPALWIAVTRPTLDAIKTDLTRALPDVKSSHRCEALARALGFRTYAAARVATEDGSEAGRREADERAFAAYLAAHGFIVDTIPFHLATARAALAEVLAAEPSLTMEGMGIGDRERVGDRWETGAERRARFDASRAKLLTDDSVEQFLRALACVSRITPTKAFTGRHDSYGLKHIAEGLPCTYPVGQPLGPAYVSNGALIAAALHAGFRAKTYTDPAGRLSLNVSFNMSLRSIRVLRQKRAEAERELYGRAA